MRVKSCLEISSAFALGRTPFLGGESLGLASGSDGKSLFLLAREYSADIGLLFLGSATGSNAFFQVLYLTDAAPSAPLSSGHLFLQSPHF
jgi:hypothetical protein